MALKEINNNTYNLEMDEEHQDEAVEAYKETLKHYEENNDKLTSFQKGATIAGGVILLAGVFREPICNAAKAGWKKAKGFVDEKIFKKPKDNTPDEDGVIDGEYKEVES